MTCVFRINRKIFRQAQDDKENLKNIRIYDVTKHPNLASKIGLLERF